MSNEVVVLNDTYYNATARPRTLTVSNRNWNDLPKLKFPKTMDEDLYKMASLRLDKGWFVFDFLRESLFFVLPYDLPVALIVDFLENPINSEKLILEVMK